MKNLPKIVVIMSTYNGEKFVKEQIDSILAQKDVDLTLHIFDDCSKDRTVDFVKEYEKKNKNDDYYAFADQDDFWLEDKLISAINKIKEKGKCSLYCSNLKIVDENLIYAGNNMMPQNYINKHYDILCKNIVTGCTVVMDNDFKNLATKFYPENIYLHDYWLALIANYCKDANFIYDEDPSHILYRQHGTNLIGSNKNILKKFKKKVLQKSSYNLVKNFYQLYGNFIIENDLKVFKKASELNKIKNRFLLFFKIKSNFSLEFKIKLLLNNY